MGATSVIGVDLQGEILRVGEPEKVDFSTEHRVRVRLKWPNRNEVNERKSAVIIKLEARSSSVISPGRGTVSAKVKMKCSG
jgi:hypothetical protein